MIKFLKIITIVFLILSCTNEELKIDTAKVYYIFDENLSASFMVVYPYKDTSSLSASLTLTSNDGLYTWVSNCYNYSLKGETYLVAGPFFPSENTDEEMTLNATLNYRDTKQESQIKVQIPDSIARTPLSVLSYTPRQNDIYNFRYDGNRNSQESLTIAVIDNAQISKKIEMKGKSTHVNIPGKSSALAVFHNHYSNLIFTKKFNFE